MFDEFCSEIEAVLAPDSTINFQRHDISLAQLLEIVAVDVAGHVAALSAIQAQAVRDANVTAALTRVHSAWQALSIPLIPFMVCPLPLVS